MIPEEKKDRHGLYITAAAGMNSFQWPMTYPSGVKMVDTEFHKRPDGPLAKPGTYHATLTVGDWSMTQSFELLKDPRISTSDADLAEQFDFLIRIRDKLSEIVTGVNTIRSLKRQLGEWVDATGRQRVGGSCDRRRDGAAGTARMPSRPSSCRPSSRPTATR